MVKYGLAIIRFVLPFILMSKGRVKKRKKWEFSHCGGGGLPIWVPFPTFFIYFLTLSVIQKCKEIFFQP